ncbi:hypothetical protein BJV78DRAFT_744203 [Lactifluus subvellereus]|nr:hypothetical protein BJV78DRAFT_744203 [Lactifluus subvellereus]
MDQDQHFLPDLDNGFRPPGLLPDSLNLSPHHPAFDSFDLRSSSPHFAELDFEAQDDSLGLDNDPLVVPPGEDYDPSKYDAPSSSTGLLVFDDSFMSGVNDSNRVSVSVTPADDAHSPGYYDHGSPSSNGGAESGAENDRRSPASSVSSHLGVNASPHLDFNQLRVESPYHQPVPIPGEGSSPQLKPQSPPLLVIPDLSQPGGYQQDRPVIHAPRGDGVGPRLHIVPATPVSGGVDTTQTAGFRNTIRQGSATPSTVPSSSWTHHSSDPSANSAQSQPQPASEFRSGAGSADASGLTFNFPGASQSIRTTTDLSATRQGDDFLLPPSPSRTRSKSDTSARPPQWNSGLFNQQPPLEPGSSNFAGGRTVHMNDVLPPVDVIPRPSSSASALQASFSSGSLPHPFSFQNSNSQGTPSFLSPDSAVLLRRARSDGGGGPRLTHRQSRSEDLRPQMLGPHPSTGIPSFPPSRHSLPDIAAPQVAPGNAEAWLV